MEVQVFIKKRIDKLRKTMIHRGMGAVILEKPENVMYFTGFNPVLNSMPVFFIMKQAVTSDDQDTTHREQKNKPRVFGSGQCDHIHAEIEECANTPDKQSGDDGEKHPLAEVFIRLKSCCNL